MSIEDREPSEPKQAQAQAPTAAQQQATPATQQHNSPIKQLLKQNGFWARWDQATELRMATNQQRINSEIEKVDEEFRRKGSISVQPRAFNLSIDHPVIVWMAAAIAALALVRLDSEIHDLLIASIVVDFFVLSASTLAFFWLQRPSNARTGIEPGSLDAALADYRLLEEEEARQRVRIAKASTRAKPDGTWKGSTQANSELFLIRKQKEYVAQEIVARGGVRPERNPELENDPEGFVKRIEAERPLPEKVLSVIIVFAVALMLAQVAFGILFERLHPTISVFAG